MFHVLIFTIYFAIGGWTVFERNDRKIITLFVAISIAIVILFGVAHFITSVAGLHLLSAIMVFGYLVGGLMAAFIQYHSQMRQE